VGVQQVGRVYDCVKPMEIQVGIKIHANKQQAPVGWQDINS
jgi:hypothetical protein